MPGCINFELESYAAEADASIMHINTILESMVLLLLIAMVDVVLDTVLTLLDMVMVLDMESIRGMSGSKCYQFVWTFAFKTAKGLLSFSSYYHIYFLKLIAGTIGYSINDYNVDLFFLDRIVPMVTLTYGKI